MNNSDKIPARPAGGSNGVKCDKIRELLSAYMDGELLEKEAAEVRRHLTECLNCEKALLELNKIRQMVKELPQLKAPAGFAKMVRDGIEQGAKSEEPITRSIFWKYRPAFLRDSASFRWTIRGLATAAAAFLVVYVGVVLISHKNEQVETPSKSINKSGDLKNMELPRVVVKRQSNDSMPNKKQDESLASKAKVDLTFQEQGGTYNFTCVEYPERPVAFSQELRISSKDKNATLRNIRNIASEVCGGNLSEGNDRASSNLSMKTEQLTPDTTTEVTKQHGSSQPKREYKIKVILPIDKREAFIEQLKINKIGTVKMANLTTSQTDSITVNKMLQEQVVNQVTEQLRNEFELLKGKEGRIGGGAIAESNKSSKKKAESIEMGEANHDETLGQPSPNDLNAKNLESVKVSPKPTAAPCPGSLPVPLSKSSAPRQKTPQPPAGTGVTRGERTGNIALQSTPVPPAAKESAQPQTGQKDELKKIDDSLIILHDLEQQKKAATQGLAMEKEEDLKEDGLIRDKSSDKENAEADYGKNQKQESKLPLIELIIIIQEE